MNKPANMNLGLVRNVIPEKLFYMESSEMCWAAINQAFAPKDKTAMRPGRRQGGGRWQI